MTKRAPDPFPGFFLPRGTPAELDGWDRSIGDAADHLIARLDALKFGPAAGGLTGEDVRFLTYCLIMHRVRDGGTITEAHLRLLHAALKIGRVPAGALKLLGLPSAHWAEFLQAAKFDAAGELSVRELARKVGVERATIRNWRKNKRYQQRVKHCRSLPKAKK